MKAFLIGLLMLATAAPLVGAETTKKKMAFRPALIAAAEDAAAAGKISKRDLRLIKFATLFPRIEKQVQAAVAEKAVADGAKPPCADPYIASVGWDWESLIAFLEKLMPMILQLIQTLMDLFSIALPPGMEQFAYVETVVPIVGQCAGGVCPMPQQVVVTPGAGEAGPVMVQPQAAPLQFQPGQPVRNIGRAIVRPLRWLRPRNWFRGRCR